MRRFPSRAAVLAALVFGFATAATAATVEITAARDATLIEDPDGAWANGSGPALFAGRINQVQNSVRRAALAFDVARALPSSALIDAVELRLNVVSGHSVPVVIGLHRLLEPWGEGPASSSGGGGAPSQAGDVTWIHTFYDGEFWVHEGGLFLPSPSGQGAAADPGAVVFESTLHMVRDVRLWNQNPEMNFGWMLIGDETAPQTVKAFASREVMDPALRPVLIVTYHLPGEEPTEP
jgi:hypothetical protein